MFDNLSYPKKKRRWNAGTLSLSVGAHLLLVAVVVSAGVGTAESATPDEGPILWTEIPPPLARTVAPELPPAEEAAPTDRPPAVGESRDLDPPTEVPDEIFAPDPDQRPSDPSEHNGGRIGDVIGTPQGDPAPPSGTGGGAPGAGPEDVWIPEMVEEVPALRNASEMRREFDRVYPSRLRARGVTGRAMLQFIVAADGRVEAGSVKVLSATHPDFGEAAQRAVDRFRFTPAMVDGRAVRVLISIPVEWAVAD